MKIINPTIDLTEKPIQEFKPITDLNGNIINDLCISDQAKIYKYSEMTDKNKFISDCEDLTEKYTRLGGPDKDRLYIRSIYIPGLNASKTSSLSRVVRYVFDDEKRDSNFYKTHEVDHINPSRPLDDRPKNLRWTTPNENMYNAGESGVMCKKYNKDLAEKVCKMIISGFDRQEIHNTLDVPVSLVDDIHSGRSHKSVSSKYLDKGFSYHNNPRRPRNERLEEAHKICKLLEEGKPNNVICDTLNVDSGLVTSIAQRISYKDVSCNYNIDNYYICKQLRKEGKLD